MALSSFSDSGTPVPRGEAGDLVCVKPFPCMPREFWRDEGGEKYRKAYFERFEGVWHHGDYVVITEDREGNGGGVIMQGRSDGALPASRHPPRKLTSIAGVLNPQGIRFGSSELYECLEELNDPSIEDSLVVGQPNADRSDERVVMFLQMKEAEKLGEELVKKIKTFIRSRCVRPSSSRHLRRLRGCADGRRDMYRKSSCKSRRSPTPSTTKRSKCPSRSSSPARLYRRSTRLPCETRNA